MLIKWMSVGCPYAFFSLPVGEGRGGVCRECPYAFIRQKCPHKAHNAGIQRYAPDAQAN